MRFQIEICLRSDILISHPRVAITVAVVVAVIVAAVVVEVVVEVVVVEVVVASVCGRGLVAD